MSLTRRRALLAAAALPAANLSAAADDAPPPPATAPPQPAPAAPPPPAPPPVPSVATTPPVPPASTPAPPTPAPPAPRPPAAPAPGPTAAIDRTKTYFVYFDQNLDVASLRALRRQCATLAEAGVPRIVIMLHSTGGLVDPTLTTFSFLRALPCTIDTHAFGFIASAANLLFLAGSRRTANRNCRFLFHPTSVPFSGTMTGDQMRDRLTQFDAVGAAIAEIYRERTTFTPEELARFGREEVIYTADQARAGGLVHEIADLRLPDPAQARIVFVD